MMRFEQDDIARVLDDSIEELLLKDTALLVNDVSERAITHKLAEYLQARLAHYNVDCEYNRDATQGAYAPKRLRMLEDDAVAEMATQLQARKVADISVVSAYPDIIVHRRLTNESNLLVIEVKKKNSRVDHEYDRKKLRAFTEKNGPNPYYYRYGVFLVFETRHKSPRRPAPQWFVAGREQK